jgi:hypothetical protein
MYLFNYLATSAHSKHRAKMKKTFLLFVTRVGLLVFPFALSAQVHEGNDFQVQQDRINVILGIQDLKSTHNTYFKGGSLIADYAISRVFSLGLGVEYSYCPFHHDNASDLTNLQYVPVFIDTRLRLPENGRLIPYWRFSTGISFATYTNKELDTQRNPYTVNERGLYMLTAIGCSYKICRFFTPFIEVGLKAFHMSLNNLDVNPHGSVLTLGLVF